MADKNNNPKATEAAQKAADDAGLDIDKVKPSKGGGNVTKEDVAAAQEKQEQAESKLIYVKINEDLNARSATGSDGVARDMDQPQSLVTTEANYNDVLSKDVDREGNRLFYKGGSL